MGDFDVVCSAGSLRTDRTEGVLHLDHRWTPGGVDLSAAFAEAHLLHAAVAACVLNDLYREASRLGIQLDGVRVRAGGGFTDSWASTGIAYTVEVDSPADPASVEELIAIVDRVAEIPRALRSGTVVERTPAAASTVGRPRQELGRDDLRGALYRGDAAALLTVLVQAEWPEDSLQLLGDGVLVVARESLAGPRSRPGAAGGGPGEAIESGAGRCVAALRARGWQGDAELAAQIEAALGWGPVPLLRSLAVDLEEFSDVLEGDPLDSGGLLDLRTGDVWPRSVLDNVGVLDDDMDPDDDERWLLVASEGSRPGYRDMELFIDSRVDGRVADRLARAIQGRGAFRRFNDTLRDQPDLLERWFAFRDERLRGRARAWLEDEGYTPAPRQPSEI